MRRSRFLQFLSIPAALGLGTALVLACSEGVPTSPNQQETAPAFKKAGHKGGGHATIADDVDGVCKNNWTLTEAVGGYAGYDTNINGFICVYTP